ncbi:MAG: hypothetical protein UHS41_05720 [Lachnospiraceae bacterium]|nr:hypothetical protein [Lachnospiraceae bacterium]
MLGKLIKYDLKAMGKTMVPLWITVIIIGLIYGIQTYFGFMAPMFDEGMSGILILVLFSIFLAIFVLNIIFVIQRFWNGLLKEEGYLMFTLPVSIRSLILSKSISSFLISLGSVITAGIVASFMALGAFSYQEVKDFVNEISSMIVINSEFIIDMILQMFIIILSIISGIYEAYAAMAIGHLSNKNRFVFSFVSYIVLSGIVGTIEGFIIDILDNMMLEDLVYSILMLVLTIVLIIVYHAITEFILRKRLNLE